MLEKLKQLIHLFQSNESEYLKSDYNEQECRLEFIDAFLECLGWDVTNKINNPPSLKEVKVEKYVQNMKKPDYTMTFHGFNKFFVEAKKPSVDITLDPEPSFQARRYGWNAKHNIVVLTNFKNLYIYDTTVIPKHVDGVNICLLKKYHYLEYLQKYDEICSLIGRYSVYSGEFDKLFENNLVNPSLISVDKSFLDDINGWRIDLANKLYQIDKAKYSDMELLNDSIQLFINRLVFLRICEDRNLKTYIELNETIKDESVIKEKLNILFKKSDAQYNSGLFDGEGILFDLDNEIIMEMVKRLYYPQSPYLFNIIETNILGEIYEIFLTEHLCFKEDGKIGLEKKQECKDKSIVTTPIEIVNSIIEKCIDFEPKNLNDIYNYKIIDIACGSGVFLEEAFKKICNVCYSWCENNDVTNLEYTSNGNKKIKYNIKKNILENCIFGVDIDPRAVEVCKFSLLIKLLEDESDVSLINEKPILPNLDQNIQCGNSLIEMVDVKGVAISNLLNINPFNWTNINNSRKFDCVIGNPPYVKTEDIHKINTKEEFNIYCRKYKSAYKQFDKYFLFIEKALSILKNKGVLGMIVPNKFLKIDAAKKLRELLVQSRANLNIIDFGSNQIFEEKTIYSSLLIAKKSNIDEVIYVKCDSKKNLVVNEFYDNLRLKTSELDGEVWAFSTLFNATQTNAFLDLSSKADIYNGIQTSMEKPHIYWIEKKQIVSENYKLITFNFNGKTFKVEKSILRPYFKPINNNQKGNGSYDLLETDKYIIYPYSKEGVLFGIEIMKKKYPNCFKYLKSFYSLLVPKQVNKIGRRDVPSATKDTWYQFGRTQNLTAFNDREKIVVKNMFEKPMFAYDDTNMILSSGGTAGYSAVSARKDVKDPYSIEFIQAWLASDITVSIFKDIASQFEGGFYAIGTAKLNKIRIANLDFKNPTDKKEHDKVTKIVREIREIKKQMKLIRRQIEINTLNLKIESLISEVNGIIKKIYERKFMYNEIEK